MTEKLTLDKIRKQIAHDSLTHIRECKLSKNVSYFVVRSFPGSGKTTSIMMAIDKAGFTWLYLAPFHDVIRENLKYSKLREYEFHHFKSKSQDGMCLSEDYKEYADQGFNITAFCETRCPYKNNGCPYYETKTLIESYPSCWAGVHSHVPTYLQKFLYEISYERRKMLNYYDAIIIDEFPFQVLFNQVIIQKSDIDELRDVINRMIDCDEKDLVMDILNEMTLATGSIPINYSRIKNLISNTRGLDFREFNQDYDAILLRLISNKEIHRPPKNFLFNISMIYNENPSLKKLKWMIYQHAWDGWSKTGIYITTSNVKYFKNLPIPVIALDATAEIKAWNTLLNDECSYESIDMKYTNIYQLLSRGRYPVSTWVTVKDNKKTLSSTGERLCDLIIKICNRKNNAVLLCSNKRIKKLTGDYLSKNYEKDNYKFAIFYNLRSRNEYYENCDTCIVIHEPNIPPLQLDIMKNVIGWDESMLRKLMTESEIKQAIGRIRQNILITPSGRIREDVEIYILPGSITSDNKIVPEAKLIPYVNMAQGNLNTLGGFLEEAIRKVGETTLKKLRKATSDLCSRNELKKELMKMYNEGFISNYKRSIKWKNKEVEYERKFNKNIYISK